MKKEFCRAKVFLLFLGMVLLSFGWGNDGKFPKDPKASVSIKFEVTVDCHMPEGEMVGVNVQDPVSGDWYSALGTDKGGYWEISLPSGITAKKGDTLGYCYFRNTDNAPEINGFAYNMRRVDVGARPIVQKDQVNRWEYWPKDGVIPSINTGKHLDSPPPYAQKSNGFYRGMALPDWRTGDITPEVFEENCDKIIKRTGANFIRIFQYYEIIQWNPKPVFQIYNDWGFSRERLQEYINIAHQKGLKFHYVLWTNLDFVENNFPDNTASSWWKSWEEALGDIFEDEARFCQANDVDIFEFDFPLYGNLWQNFSREYSFFNQMYLNIISRVKGKYKGILASGNIYKSIPPEFSFWHELDMMTLHIYPQYPWSLSKSLTPTVEEMAKAISEGLDEHYKPICETYGLQLYVQPTAASFDGWVSGSGPWEEQYWPKEDTVLRKIDLQEQADMVEAFFQGVLLKDYVSAVSGFFYYYWDAIDRSPSVRGKPAEEVIAKWYNWIQAVPAFQILKDK